MNTKDDIKLPPLHYDELPEPDDPIPAMHNYARRAIKDDRQRRGETVGYIRVDQLKKVRQGWSYMCQIQPEPQQGTVAIYTTPQPIEQAVMESPEVQVMKDALRELISIVEIHSSVTKNNFAWAELDEAKSAIAAMENKKND